MQQRADAGNDGRQVRGIREAVRRLDLVQCFLQRVCAAERVQLLQRVDAADEPVDLPDARVQPDRYDGGLHLDDDGVASAAAACHRSQPVSRRIVASIS